MLLIRGIYGGIPRELAERGRSLAGLGINAIFTGSRSINDDAVAFAQEQNVKLFAEFNTLHMGDYVVDHRDAAPVGPDGQLCPPPHDWQGVCPTHPAYREWRMDEFRRVLGDYAVDGMWLDYLHSHAAWERADPLMPDTCFCDRCLAQIERDTGIGLPAGSTSAKAAWLLNERRDAWVAWRCSVLTDWLREFRQIMNATRPGALLGNFHCPWSDEDFNGARISKLNIDLKAHAAYVDVFSPMPYHARFGHAADRGWIGRQVRWLGEYLGIRGVPEDRHRIWPIVQVTEWSEPVPVAQVREVIEQGTQAPSTGVMVFAWDTLKSEPDKIAEIGKAYRGLAT